MLRMLAGTWLVPPALNILLLGIGLLLLRRYRLAGIALSVLGLVSLWLLSTLFVSSLLVQSLERYPVADPEIIEQNGSQAIVLLGSAHIDQAIEYGVSTPTADALVRLHYAANLHHRTGLPIMVTGGPMNARQDIHADVLAESLESQFSITAKWSERKSATTWQNALFAAEVLHPIGVTNVVLVTHSYHMQRAVRLFELAGFTVTAAPTQLSTVYPWREWFYWMPESRSLNLSARAIHEYIGLIWYQLVSPVGNTSEREVELYGAG